MTTNTKTAIQKRINIGETSFFLGRYYYECDTDGFIRRIEQRRGYLPTSDWEFVTRWDPFARKI